MVCRWRIPSQDKLLASRPKAEGFSIRVLSTGMTLTLP